MEWLNYHHLLYFWMVAREGSVTRASSELRLAQPTISTQIRMLEESLGEKLFARQGRNLVLTDVGLTLRDLVKVTVFLSDRKFREEESRVRAEILGDRHPALTIIIAGIWDEVDRRVRGEWAGLVLAR